MGLYCVQPGELISPGPWGGLYTDALGGGVSSERYHPFAWMSSSLSSCLSTEQAPRLAPARPLDEFLA